jgi:ferredoxin
MPEPGTATRRRTAQLRVDRVACTAHGVCASLLPRQVRLDEWGYPILDDPAVDPLDGQTAVTMCPAQALYLA